MWTKFYDMHSGGDAKTEWEVIVFEAKKKDAIKYANWKWGIHPDNVTCTCCGEDFSVSTYETLDDAVKFQLNYSIEKLDIFVVPASELEKTRKLWKKHTITRKGYVYCEW